MNMKTTIPLLVLLFVITTIAVSTTVVANDSSSSSSWYERTTTATSGGRRDLLLLIGAEDEQEHHPLTRNLQVKQPDVCYSNRKDCYCYEKGIPACCEGNKCKNSDKPPCELYAPDYCKKDINYKCWPKDPYHGVPPCCHNLGGKHCPDRKTTKCASDLK